jgi:hypothetical protein
MNQNQVSTFLGTLVISLVLVVGFALPAFAMGKGGTGGTGGTGGDPGTQLHVSCIAWPTTANGRHVHAVAYVEDENGTPINGAVVSMSARRDGVEYNVVGGPTEDYAGIGGGETCPNGPPGSGSTRDFCVNSAPSGYYDAEVLSVTYDGYTWDGTTPPNGSDFVGKAKN